MVWRAGSPPVFGSSSSDESESDSGLPLFMRVRLLRCMTRSSFSFALLPSACVPATAKTVAGYVLRLSPRSSGRMSKERQGHLVLSVWSISYVDGSGARDSPACSFVRFRINVWRSRSMASACTCKLDAIQNAYSARYRCQPHTLPLLFRVRVRLTISAGLENLFFALKLIF